MGEDVVEEFTAGCVFEDDTNVFVGFYDVIEADDVGVFESLGRMLSITHLRILLQPSHTLLPQRPAYPKKPAGWLVSRSILPAIVAPIHGVEIVEFVEVDVVEGFGFGVEEHKPRVDVKVRRTMYSVDANEFDERMIELCTRPSVSGVAAYLIPVEELWDLV